MRFFDTHAHLNLAPLATDADEILQKAKELNITVNVVGVDGPSSQLAYALACRHDNAFCSVAVHPNNVDALGEEIEQHMAVVEHLLENDRDGRIVAVGETGLDASRGSDLLLQTACFKRHVILAERFGKPLNLHCRDAHAQMLGLLGGVKARVIMHCFTAGPEEASQYVRLGCFLSFPGVVTFKNAEEVHAAVQQTPWTNLLVETDAPYLAPVPFRGQVNTPLHLPCIVDKIASLKETGRAEAAAILFENAMRAFGIKSA